jgi:hypothetical protein
MAKRSTSRGVRNPVQRSVLYGLGLFAGIALVLLGIVDMRQSGRGNSWMLMLGLFPALLCPIFLVYYLSRIRVFADLRSGRTAIARWTVPAAQFAEFCAEQRRIPARSVMVNFYKPPRNAPAKGIDVIFSDRDVLIGDGYFPLSPTGKRRLEGVRYNAAYPPTIEFGLVLETAVRTSPATIGHLRSVQTLRVPVAMDARNQVDRVVEAFEARLRN